jgi:asparagine synthase (glutamine-hydrolysing)
MPGIVGCVTSLPREHAEEKVLRMLEVVCSEDYASGMWIEESLGLYIGWVTRKNSFSDGMPLWNERGDVALVFSGEEFPDAGTDSRLRQRGHDLDGSGPAYLVHLYEEDPSFPAGLNGRFHGVLIDRRRRTAFLFNDRYAMHRIYCHRAEDGFYFAAEAKAILAICPETRKLDMQAVGEFVACGCTLEERTLFHGIHVLPGGSKWFLRNGGVSDKRAYFKPEEWENQEPLAPELYYSELRDIFCRNLPRYFRGPEKIGMSLTGGLDTRMIMAWQTCSPGTLPCYTFGGPLRDCQDIVLARQIAAMCGQPHEVIRVGTEFLTEFPHYAERAVLLTDGCVDVGRCPDLYSNEKAREIAPARMSGVCGGEVLRRVLALKPEDTRSDLFVPELGHHIDQAKTTYSRHVQGHPVSFAVFKEVPWALYGVLSLEQTQISLRAPFLDNDLVRTVFRAPEAALASNKLCVRLIAEGNDALLRIPTDRGLLLNGHRLSGAVSNALLEFLFKAEYAYDLGMPQWLARLDHAFSAVHVDRLFLGRHKVFHFRLWYRDALAGYVRDTLLDPRSLSRSYIEPTGLKSIVEGHLNGNRNYTLELHKVLTLELVHRLLLENQWANRTRETFDLALTRTNKL